MPLPAPMTAGVTQQGSSVDGMVWHILGQTYTPLQVTESSFSWHALLPPGTFVPPHIHPTQDEFIYVFEGRFDLVLDGKIGMETLYHRRRDAIEVGAAL